MTVSKEKIIFVSHDGNERELAEILQKHLCKDFNRKPARFYISGTSGDAGIGGGEEWAESIHKNLSRTGLMISLLSPHSYLNPWVPFEAGFVWKRAPIFPLWHSGLSISDIRVPIASHQGGDCVEIRTFQRLYEAVRKMFAADLLPDLEQQETLYREFNLAVARRNSLRLRRTISQAGFICVLQESGKAPMVLLQQSSGGRRMNFPKGKTQPSRSNLEIAVSELEEEAGILQTSVSSIRSIEVIEYAHSDRSKSAIEYFAGVTSVSDLTPTEESTRRKPTWVSFEQASAMLEQNRLESEFRPLVELLWKVRAELGGFPNK